jgi:hypothetical protein
MAPGISRGDYVNGDTFVMIPWTQPLRIGIGGGDRTAGVPRAGRRRIDPRSREITE